MNEPSPAWIQSWSLIASATARGISDVGDLRREIVRELEANRSSALAITSTTWPHLYRLSYRQCIAISVLGLFAASPAEFLRLAPWRLNRVITQMASGQFNTSSQPVSKLSGRIAFASTAPIVGHIRALTNFRKTVDQLLALARRGDREALRRAIRSDPSVLLIPPASRELALASYAGDTDQLAWIASAVRDAKEFDSAANGTLRVVVQLMHETQQLDKLTPASARIIFINRTRLYPSTGDTPPEINLWANIKNWKRDAMKNSEPVFSSRYRG